PESFARDLAIGMPAQLTGGNGQPFPGEISAVSPEVVNGEAPSACAAGLVVGKVPRSTNTPLRNWLVTAPTDATSRAQWKDWIAHDDAVFIEGFELFDSYTAIA
ncbi:hypothetical protein, partial [Stenotrophomonas sp. 3diitr2024]|uniref:hypothetical protein n=1 Tax=Stenotrophomonas sp. 3diitr2024 TaxID=3345115 RepID=UPI0035CA261E